MKVTQNFTEYEIFFSQLYKLILIKKSEISAQPDFKVSGSGLTYKPKLLKFLISYAANEAFEKLHFVPWVGETNSRTEKYKICGNFSRFSKCQGTRFLTFDLDGFVLDFLPLQESLCH